MSLITATRHAASVVDRWHWVVLGLAAPALLFPSASLSPILFVVPVLWLVGWVAHPRTPLPSTPLNAAVLLLIVMVLVSVVVTPDLAFSLPKVAGMVLATGAFFAMAREAQRKTGLLAGILLFLTTGVAVAGLSLVGTDWTDKIGFLSVFAAHLGTHPTGLPGAPEGFHPNEVAGALLWVIPIFPGLLAGILLYDGWPAGMMRRILFILAILLLGITALFTIGVFALTQSRSGYVALGITMAAAILVSVPARTRWALVTACVLIAALGMALVWRAGPQALAQQLAAELTTPADPDGILNKAAERTEIWARAVYGIEHNPVTGVGMNQFRFQVFLYPAVYSIVLDYDIAHAHNEFLQVALDLGIPGLVAFGALYLTAGWMLWRVWAAGTGRVSNSLHVRALALAFGSGLLAHLIFGLTDAVALGAKPGLLFWMLLGLICGLFAQVRAGSSLSYKVV